MMKSSVLVLLVVVGLLCVICLADEDVEKRRQERLAQLKARRDKKKLQQNYNQGRKEENISLKREKETFKLDKEEFIERRRERKKLREEREFREEKDEDENNYNSQCQITPVPELIMYLRIGKAGSSSMRSWIGRAKRHDVQKSSGADIEYVLNREEERELVKRIDDKRGKARVVVHDGQHVYFPNFTRFGLEQPIMFTMMREPAKRYVSQYNYWRTLGGRFGKDVHEKGADLSECAQPGNEYEGVPFGCPIPNYQTVYLCGHGPPCEKPPTLASFRQAKKHLVENINLVGTIERFSTTQKLMAYFFPSVFKPTWSKTKANVTKKRAKEPQVPVNWTAIKELNHFDYRLYEIAVKKMKRLCDECDIEYPRDDDKTREMNGEN